MDLGPARTCDLQTWPALSAGKSAVINALLGRRYLAEGILPTTNEISVLKWGDSAKTSGSDSVQVRAEIPNMQLRCRCRGTGPCKKGACREIPGRTADCMAATATCPCLQEADGVFTRQLPAELLREVNVVDTPGTNVILERQQRLTEEYVPRADLVSLS